MPPAWTPSNVGQNLAVPPSLEPPTAVRHYRRRLNHARPLLRLLVLGTLLFTEWLWACSVPVFRYAWEKWPADAYPATVFHRGPLSAAQQALLRDLSAEGPPGRSAANVSLELVDLAQTPAPAASEPWWPAPTNALPWLVVRYPPAARLPGQVVSAPLAETTVRQLLGSPARQELTRRLQRGESAVWVLLEIGDRQRDAATAKLAETRLAYLASVLKLPALDPADIAAGLVSVPAGGLKLAFSVVRVSRTDPAERAFVAMLLGTEADLDGIKEPILFPVFGRGRALYALAGAGINHATIDEAATFLIGKCSCQVKELNPGVDLLLATDWAAAVQTPSATQRSTPPLTAAGEAAPEAVTISGGPADAAPARPTLLGELRWAGGFAITGLLVAIFWLKRK